MGGFVADELGKILNTKVSIQKIDAGLINQIMIEGLEIRDQKNKPMLYATKTAASIELIPLLLHGKIIIHTGQLFNLKADLYQEAPDKPNNFQFVLDALASKDNTESSLLDLRINSFILRDGAISYNQLYQKKKETFDVSHLKFSDINAHLSIKELTNESLVARIRDFSFKETSGLTLNNLSLLLESNQSHTLLTNLRIDLPGTSICLDSLETTYKFGEKLSIPVLQSKGYLSDSHITLADFKPFVPLLGDFEEPLHLSFQFLQEGSNLAVNQINLKSNGNYINLQSDLITRIPTDSIPIRILATIKNLDIQPSGYPLLFNNLNLGKSPAVLTRLGKTHFEGEVVTNLQDIDVDGNLITAVGSLTANAKLKKNKDIEGEFHSTNLNLGKLLANSQLGATAFHINYVGQLVDPIPTGKISGIINYLEYNNYRYNNINLDAFYNSTQLNGQIYIDDENCLASIDGDVLFLGQKSSAYNVSVDLKKLDIYGLGLGDDEGIYRGKLFANCSGTDLENLQGTLRLEDFQMEKPDDYYSMDSIVVQTSCIDGRKTVSLFSSFFNAQIEGNFQYATLPQSIIKIAEQHLPSLIKVQKSQVPDNQFSISARLTDAAPLNHFLGIPLILQDDIILAGQFNDRENLVHLDLAAGSFIYDEEQYELGRLLCFSEGKDLKSSIGLSRIKKGLTTTLSMEATAQDDNLFTTIAWDNNQEKESFNGILSTRTRFQQSLDNQINVNVSILPSDITLNDTIWHIRPGMVDYRDKKVLVSHLALENGPRHFIANGIIGNEPSDTLTANLKEINLEYAFDALNFHPVHMAGIATGKAIATSLLTDLDFDAQLFIKNFQFEHGLLGNMNLHGNWDKSQEGIYLNGYISEFASESKDSVDIWRAFRKEIDASALTHVEGIVSPKHERLDLHVDANNTNIHFVESFIGGVFENLQGRATGWARVAGTFADIDLTAELKADASLKVISLNTNYQVHSDSIALKTNRMEFNNLSIKDKDGHIAQAEGVIRHFYLHDMRYAFDIDTNNLLVFDTRGFDDQTFYATAYGSGHLSLRGEGNELEINGDIETNPGTIIAYDASTPEDITDTQFITFVDKTPSLVDKEELESEVYLPEEEEEATNIHINLNVNCTPDATIRVLMDKVSGNDITLHGTGNLQAEYFNKGAFKLYGIFNISRGVYKMSLQEIIRKDFQLNSGTITFNGKPFDGQLDMQAIYVVNSASLRDLSPSATFSQKSTTKVNCLMNLTGNLLKPQITFDLELPNVSDEDKSMVRSLVATEDQMNRQILYLLGIGRFYTDEYNQDSNQANQAMNSLLTSTISGQFNQILSQVANSNNWNFGANLNPGQDGLNNMEFQTMLSGSLFNNRLLINGNFGYRENALANTNFVGDFDLQWLLNQSGTISLKAYNETNDRYFTKNTLTTQGIGILFKRDFQHWSDLFRTNEARKKSATNENAADSSKVVKQTLNE